MRLQNVPPGGLPTWAQDPLKVMPISAPPAPDPNDPDVSDFIRRALERLRFGPPPASPDLGSPEVADSLAGQNYASIQATGPAAVTPAQELQPGLAGQQAGAQAALGAYRAAGVGAPNPADYRWNPIAAPQYPTHQFEPVPQRTPAHVDPWSSGLAALAGIVDPHGAGHYGAAPLHQAVQYANQSFADAEQRRAIMQQNADQSYRDQVAQLQQQLQLATMNQEQSRAGTEALQGAQLGVGRTLAPLAGQAAGAGAELGALGPLAAAQRGQNIATANARADQFAYGVPAAQFGLDSEAAGLPYKFGPEAINAAGMYGYHAMMGQARQESAAAQTDRAASYKQRVDDQYELGLLRVDKMGKTVGADGKPLTPFQKARLALTAVQAGLDPKMFGLDSSPELAAAATDQNTPTLSDKDPQLALLRAQVDSTMKQKDAFHQMEVKAEPGSPEQASFRAAAGHANDAYLANLKAFNDYVAAHTRPAPLAPPNTAGHGAGTGSGTAKQPAPVKAGGPGSRYKRVGTDAQGTPIFGGGK